MVMVYASLCVQTESTQVVVQEDAPETDEEEAINPSWLQVRAA
jgi:hypothetical protein